ncbi:MAG TPA: TonB-dependent receptor [Verrucomicrobiae bacterium]|nr:TonB-dependent receptor [Verrucomicrobiae bacterium]
MKPFEQKKLNRRIYWAVISSVALTCGGAAMAQTNEVVAATNSVASSETSTNVANLGNVTVVGQLNQARSQIMPNLGATAYTHTSEQILSQSQGANAPMTKVILRSPGVAGDNEASGALHVRGEHANLQYRINDVLLPEGISGFGMELDPRFVDSMQLITGSLPAQYGFRTAGIVNIQTRSGMENGGSVEMYGGSYDTIHPSAEIGGTEGKWSIFADGSYDHNALGIENPTPSHDAIHDNTEQYKGFIYASRILTDTSRLTIMGSASYSDFQIPNTPGLSVGTAPGGNAWNSTGALPANFNSSNLNENQNEQNYYGVVAYQQSIGDLNFQASVFGRDSSVHFMPDVVGDLYFNGVSSDVERALRAGGFQFDASYELNEKHTLRGGVLIVGESVQADSTTGVFALDGSGNPAGSPFPIVDNNSLYGIFAGVYLQDEWKVLPEVTVNFGARFDEFYSSFDKENEPSPRVNLIYTPTDSTTLHAGYAHYFTPPPVEDVPAGTVSKFDGTSNASATGKDNPVKAERANYFDVGLTQKILPGLQVGVDGYYKYAKNQLDDGLFGQSLILSAFNYTRGRIYGVEFTSSYTHDGLSLYANVAYSVAQGQDWNSSQFLFDPADIAYVKNHWIYLDHDQRVTGSFGASYLFKEGEHNSTRVYVDAIYGSGLRTDAPGVPNGASLPAYYTVNIGAEHTFKLPDKKLLKARLDVVNVTDNTYLLRDGSGVGVNAASYGERLGFFGSLAFVF